MKIADHLSKEQKKQLSNIKSPKKNKRRKHNNNQTKNEEKINWKEIMGMNRDIFSRRNGAVRRK